MAPLVLDALILLLILLRAYDLIRSSAMNLSRGQALRHRIEALPAPPRQDPATLAAIYSELHDRRFRFGARSYQMRGRGPSNPLRRAFAVFWQLAVFTLVVNGFLLASAGWTTSGELGRAQAAVGVVSCAMVLVCLLLSAASVFVGLATLPQESAMVIMGAPPLARRLPPPVVKMLLFGVQFVLVWISSTTALFHSSQTGYAYTALPGVARGWAGGVERYLHCVYQAFVALVGLTDPEPQSLAPRVLVILITLAGTIYLVLVIALVLESGLLKDTPTPPPAHEPPAAPAVVPAPEPAHRPERGRRVGFAVGVGAAIVGAAVLRRLRR